MIKATLSGRMSERNTVGLLKVRLFDARDEDNGTMAVGGLACYLD